MRSTNMIQLSTDVLVVGAGGAGSRAALEASRAGAEVLLCSKAPVGKAGATAYRIVELAGFNVWNEQSEGGADDYRTDIIEAGLGMADPKLAGILAEEADGERRFLESIGVEFQKLGDEYLSFTGCFASRRRTLILEGHGHAIMRALEKELRRGKVSLLENAMITDLVLIDGGIAGAVGIDEKGDFFSVQAKSVILCSGGAGRMFNLNMNPADVTGDGHALGYRAGALMTNMEFMQFGLATVHPSYNLIGNWLFPLHPVLRNRDERPLLEGNLPEGITIDEVIEDKQKHFPFTSRDRSRFIEISVQREIAAGRTTDNGGVYLDFRDVARREAELAPHDRKVWDMAKGWLESRGIDVSSQMLEIGAFAHALNGGLLIDENGESSIPGLYSAGENAAGPHGADRLGGNMLVTSQVFGRRAGLHAASYSSDARPSTAQFTAAAESLIRARFAKQNTKELGSGDLDRLRKLISTTFGRYMIVIRNEEGYLRCARCLDEVEAELAAATPASPKEFRPFAELQNMCATGRMMIESGRLRKESRGGYYRSDYPQRDDENYGHNIFIRLDSGKMSIRTGSISAERKD